MTKTILGDILEGWRNTVIPPNEIKEVINIANKHRMEVCKGCAHHSDNDPNSSRLRPDVYCTNCGCNLEAKTKCLSCECPLKKWIAITVKK